MTDKLREAAQQALEALDSDNPEIQLRAAMSLRAALAEPAQEQTLMDKFNAAFNRPSFKRGDAVVIEQRGGRLYMNDAEIDPGTLEIREDGVTYRSATLVDVGERAEPAQRAIAGPRAVIVVDRGWIFAGDVTRENGRIKLSRAVWVFRWEEIGFDGVIADPKHHKVTIKQMPNGVDIPEGAEIFAVPVPSGWGL